MARPSLKDYTWQLTPVGQNDRENEQIGDEFFNDGQVLSEISSLVRESIQNSIDACEDRSKPVRMRFTVGRQTSAVNASYFGDLHSHVQASLNASKPPAPSSDSHFLVIEDFNTTGLQGSISPKKNEKNANLYGDSFWYFEWASGQSNKIAGTRGSWGVGKIVFAAASSYKAYMVYSVRAANRAPDKGSNEILFGHSILKYATLSGLRVKPDRPWMRKSDDGDYVPITSSSEISNFVSDWKISRRNGEMGTSIVIPFSKPEITIDKLLQCIIQDYFIAILDGIVECELAGPEGETRNLTADDLIPLIGDLSDDQLTDSAKGKDELIALCNVYLDRKRGNTKVVNIAQHSSRPNDWAEIVLSDQAKEEILAALDGSSTLELRIDTGVPADQVRKVATGDTFLVLLKKDENFGIIRTVFCRQGILIPRANSESKLRNLISLVVVENGDGGRLAQLLSDAEGPAHKEWSSNADRFKGKYKPALAARATIAWVKNSVTSVHRLIQPDQNESDDRSLSRYFPMPDGGLGRNPSGANANNGEKPPRDPKKPGSTGETRKRVSKLPVSIVANETGFRFVPEATKSPTPGSQYRIRVAYAVRQGNSLSSWDDDDFLLETHLDLKSIVGAKVNCHENVAEVTLNAAAFDVSWSGFDQKRDLSIEVVAIGGALC